MVCGRWNSLAAHAASSRSIYEQDFRHQLGQPTITTMSSTIPTATASAVSNNNSCQQSVGKVPATFWPPGPPQQETAARTRPCSCRSPRRPVVPTAAGTTWPLPSPAPRLPPAEITEKTRTISRGSACLYTLKPRAFDLFSEKRRRSSSFFSC